MKYIMQGFHQINQIVYHMYGLTDAEIKIIEQSI